MNSIENKLTLALLEATEFLFLEQNLDISFLSQYEIRLERPKNSTFGDYSSNLAFDLVRSGLIHNFKPIELAQKLLLSLKMAQSKGALSFCSQIEVAAGGFINFHFSSDFLIDISIKNLINRQEIFPKILAQYLVEFSSPNIAKPFTIGHLRSTIIGNAVANLLEFSGYRVYRDNHLGDWGTQFGKQICAIERWGDVEKISSASDPVKELVALYVKFHAEAEVNPDLNVQARAKFKALEDGDAKTHQLWNFCIDISMKEFDRIYKLLDISFTENDGLGYGESFFEDKMGKVVSELREKNLLTESQGAQVVFFPNDKFPPLMILKQDGSTLYATRDLATDRFRWDMYGSDLTIINEVGSEQSLYFQQLFEVEEMLGWLKSKQKRVHIRHGMYRFQDRKMSTRKGDVIWLDDVLIEALERVKIETKIELPDSDLWKIAIGAVKWNDLSKESARDINFNLDDILNLKGNSGPYMQYTFVRCWSILKKSNYFNDFDFEKGSIEGFFIESRALIFKPDIGGESLINEELDLWRWLTCFPEVIKKATAEYATHILANYLYELATLFNTFYAKQEILGQQRREILVWLVAENIQTGLAILGISMVKKM